MQNGGGSEEASLPKEVEVNKEECRMTWPALEVASDSGLSQLRP